MTYTAPDHYSYEFKFAIDKLPAEQKDKLPNRLSVYGLIFGSMFVILGAFEIIAYFLNYSDESYNFNLPAGVSANDVFVHRYTFDTFILLFGILIVSLSVMALLRYKNVFFDGENIKIEHKPLFGEVHTETEKLYNYLGVLLKVEYYQLGLINRNRYIIELYHKDKNKRIPLYISTKGSNVREIWEYYASKLKMPALFMTDRGLVSRNYSELGRSLKNMAKYWHLNTLYNDEEHAPLSINYKTQKDKITIKERKLFFDVYSLLSCAGLLIFGSLLVYAVSNYKAIQPYISMGWFIGLIIVAVIALTVTIMLLFSKDVLIITPKTIVFGHNISFLRMDIEIMDKEDVESVDIGHNPTTERYYLSIISHNQSIIFGKNMPIDDLRWLRGCLIRKIVK